MIYIEVSFASSITWNEFPNDDVGDACFCQKFMYIFRVFEFFFDLLKKIKYYCSEFIAGQKMRFQVEQNLYFEENINVRNKVVYNIA